MEWRIALCRDEQLAKPFVMHLGDLSKIAHYVHIDGLRTDTESAFRGANPEVYLSYGGNISRRELCERLFELGDSKVTASFWL